ncbi:MAG: hypothetical protein IPM16_12825 [Chloroflexi bacterium]|nr:hypothetical protein [Chloroflexota bacterium]
MPPESMSLDGEWQFSVGDHTGTIQVPGVWEVQGYPADVYGPAVYRRAVEIPASWEGARVVLRFGAVSYFTEVYVNGALAGTHEGLWTAFEIDVTEHALAGRPNQIELRVIKPGKGDAQFHFRDVLVGFIPYVSLTFGGPWQSIELIARRAPHVSSLHIEPDMQTGCVAIEAALDTLPADAQDWFVSAQITDPAGNVVASEQAPAAGSFQTTLHVPNAQAWAPQSPALYRLVLTLRHGADIADTTERSFGFRQLSADGEQLLFNGTPIHLRGVLSWGWDPATLAPTLSEASIRDEFRRVRELGFNLVKLCLFVPPDILFQIADEEGMLLWLELPLWYQRMNDHLRQQAVIEYADIFAAVHHHPSVVIYSLGCELGSDMADAVLLDNLNTQARTATTGAMICDNSGSGEAYSGLSFDFADFNDYHFYCDLHYFGPLVDHFSRDWRRPRPWIFGEFCDSDDFRDVNEITQANGGTRPYWRDLLGIDGGLHRWSYAIQETRMAELGLPFSAQQLVHISRRESLMVRKFILEHVRSRAGMGGYVVTGLRDTPMTTSGVFDDLHRPKFAATEFRQFNADAVLALEHGRARVWRHGGDRPAPRDRFNHVAGALAEFRVVLSNAGAPLDARALRWRLVGSGEHVIDSGEIVLDTTLPAGRPQEVAGFGLRLPEESEPAQYRLEVELDAGQTIRNQWPLWAYPSVQQWPPVCVYDPSGSLAALDDLVREATPVQHPADADRVLVTSAATPEVIQFVRDGGRALVIQPGAGAFPSTDCPFWRESIKLLYDHPILRAFPHDGYADLQFYSFAPDYALDSAAFKAQVGGDCTVVPIVQRLDARQFFLLDYLLEARLGSGAMLATSLNFAGGAGDQISVFADHAAGRHLLHESIKYLSD